MPKDRADRKTVHRSASQILLLHEELLVELQAALGNASQGLEMNRTRSQALSKHTRWRSMDSPHSVVSQWDRILHHSIDTSRPHQRSFIADTQLVVAIAAVFDKFVRRRDPVAPHLTRRCIAFSPTKHTPPTTTSWASPTSSRLRRMKPKGGSRLCRRSPSAQRSEMSIGTGRCPFEIS